MEINLLSIVFLVFLLGVVWVTFEFIKYLLYLRNKESISIPMEKSSVYQCENGVFRFGKLVIDLNALVGVMGPRSVPCLFFKKKYEVSLIVNGISCKVIFSTFKGGDYFCYLLKESVFDFRKKEEKFKPPACNSLEKLWEEIDRECIENETNVGGEYEDKVKD